MSNTKIINGQVYLTGSIGNIGTLFKATPTISGHYYTFSIGQTEGVFPFGFSLIYNQGSTENAGDFGCGAKFASYQTFQLSGSNIIATNYFGESKTYKLLDELKVYEEEDAEVTYNYFCHETGTYLREDTSFYYLRDAKGNRTKLRKSDSFIYEYKGIDGSGYIYNENEEKYVEINNSSTIMLQCVNSGPYYDVISVFETYQSTNGTTTTELMSKVVLNYDDDDRICKVVYYKRGNIVESYDLTYTSEGMYMVYKVKDNTRNQVLGFYYEQGNTPKVLIKSYSASNENFGPITTVDYYGHPTYCRITGPDGNSVEYHYNGNNLSYEIDSFGNFRRYKFNVNKKIIEQSRTIMLLDSKNDDNLINNGDFSDGLEEYVVSGTYSIDINGPTTESLLFDSLNRDWLLLGNSSSGSSTVYQDVVVSGKKGAEYTFLSYFYVKQKGGLTNNIRLTISYLNVNDEVVNEKTYSYTGINDSYEVLYVSEKAQDDFTKIRVTLYVNYGAVLLVKEMGLYPFGPEIINKYGHNGRLIYSRSGKNEISYSYDSKLRLAGYIKDDVSSDGVAYDDKGRPILSVDIYGNTTQIKYNNYGEIIEQNVSVNGEIIKTKKTILRNAESNQLTIGERND